MSSVKKIGKQKKGINIMASKSGYIDVEENVEEPKLSNSVSISEQEVCINFMRAEDFATIYTSDTTYI